MGPEDEMGSHYALGSHVLMFFGFLRAGEAVAPDNSDFDPTQHLTYADLWTMHQNPSTSK